MLKSRKTENLYHSMLRSITKQMAEVGCKWDVESWKNCLIFAFATETPEFKWEPYEIDPTFEGCKKIGNGVKSHRFTQEQASNFVAWLDCWAAERDIKLEKLA